MSRTFRAWALTCLVLGGTTAQAQVNIADYNIKSSRQERIDDHHFVLTGSVELERGDTSIYADKVDYFDDQNLMIATGNVVFSQGTNRIAADSAEFDTRTSLGTFHHANGIASMQPPRQGAPTGGGILVPQATGLDTDVYFFGEKVEKLGTKKYRITNGGFSTCVQPTPRWDLSADTVVLNIDHYTLLRQAILKVKGVPMLYLPIMYYPTKEDGRATGFLLPTYGASTLRGQTLHAAFFWAINRSQDATLLYDWFSKTGSGGGGEYRYNLGAGRDGILTAYRVEDRETTYSTSSGVATLPAGTSFTLRGGANQALPNRMYARASIDYFSSLVSNQTQNTDIFNTSTNNRSYGANLVGAWRSYSLNATFDRREYFQSNTSSQVSGSSPRISFSRNERPIYTNAPVYFSAGGEFAHLDRQTIGDEVVTDDRSLTRMDFSPQIRYPFKKWQWFTVNSSAAWRETYYTRSINLVTGFPVDAGLNRSYATVQAQAVGPVLTRIWNTPDNGYAERFKHTIEPYVTVQRTTTINRREEIVQIDSLDQPYGDTTQVVYGLNNRLYAKRRTGQFSQAQEIAAIEVSQTYYSNAAQSLADPRYSTSTVGGVPSKFSAISANLRVTPTPNLNTTLRGEIDGRYQRLRTLSLNTNYSWAQRLQTTVGWSKSFYIAELPGYNDPNNLNSYLNMSANARTRDNKYGLNTSVSYDILRSTLTQERVSAFYNTQCCGIAFEYQRYNYPSSYILPSDHRFFLSFSLAGLGNFSPFSGGLNGAPRSSGDMTGPTLVTGAAGFAGRHLLDLLMTQGAEVVAWQRPNGSSTAGSGLRRQAVNLLDRQAVRSAMEAIRPARVFHLAGASHVGQAWDQTTDTLEVNVMGTQHVIDALREIVPEARLLITSSALVYAASDKALSEDHALRPSSPYGVSKLAQELAGFGNAPGPAVWIARPFNHFGPRQSPSFMTSGFAQQIAQIEAGRREPEIAVGNLEARRDLTDVRDTVRAYTMIIEQGAAERPYNVCSGHARSAGEILERLLSHARVPIRVVTDPGRYRPNDSPIVLGDAGRIRRELGWQAVVPIEQTLADLLEYWRARASSA